ncbi:MAG: hypothetical protein KQJ78_14330 [Deltaproteobacteria bacterium]|nr:hypothetical protein [Deltaproteobacteria bacterium]
MKRGELVLRLARGGLEAALALWLGLAVWWVWPRLPLKRLGEEGWWFGVGWALALGVPALLRTLGWLTDQVDRQEGESLALSPSACTLGAFVLGFTFLTFLVCGSGLGNYKLWLGAVYLTGVTLSLAGLSLWLRDTLCRPDHTLAATLTAMGIGFLDGLLMMPWVLPDLVATWPPDPALLVRPLGAAALWGGLAGAVLLLMLARGATRRVIWFVFLGLGLGLGPSLAVAWFDLLPLAVSLAVVAGLAAISLWRHRGSWGCAQEQPESVPGYWVLRAMVLLWWGAGAAVTLAVAWWQPMVGEMFYRATWLRPLLVGGFLVCSVGLLLEYSLPLLGWSETGGLGRERKVLGMSLSAAALLAALVPLLFLPVDQPPSVLAKTPARAELMHGRILLHPDDPEIELKAPTWLYGVSRLYFISSLSRGLDVEQGQAVAQVVAVDDQELPHIFYLRAGVDTAEWALHKRNISSRVAHEVPTVARRWVIYTESGEAFWGQDYLTGLYLGREVNQLKTVKVRYIYHNNPNEPPVILELKSIFVN